ncbi:hypothetical protein CDQ84_03205 [Clostridium thermosuccinogenes]|uniref:Glycosyltransferase 2-like domain-containing protein n=1 Tax=Clostridium thermosuccinogenes TaxID=84032 RepID=A0A2K2FJZ9_9CLOT|nr:glycosyltransferase family 2 protein [Pseudoclostridium thermosuccinogenes]AUS95180.1 hypothetical protein CDO33_01175 [Pseudoclostridium thermosuccinogenes]PNT99100.1 hypothetical protein CDQ85_03205 [Pseudoclostridium thermosuccinogenes]PNU00904.1 hypothetical protein CDQ84_03205 [Pseudoclostridium thermosuccinogenes]
MNYKIATVIVTYNRKNMLLKNIECLLKQSRQINKIYIIDNASTDGTEDSIKKYLDNPIIIYKRLTENIGGSGGFYTGIKQAYEDGFDYIWGMDDDAFPKVNALQEICDIIDTRKELACYWSNCNNDSDFCSNIKEVTTWMFVGFFIPKEIIDKVGLPRKDFFIYYDDDEYARRIIKKGYKIYKIRDSIISHSDFGHRENFEKKILAKQIVFPKMANWRMYYFIRNSILMYDFYDKKKYIQLLYVLPKIFMKLVLLGVPQKKVFFKAYIDGVRGKSGIVMRP